MITKTDKYYVFKRQFLPADCVEQSFRNWSKAMNES